MMHVKNMVHSLRVKWFQQLCANCGSPWLKFIWPILTVLIPPELLQGLCSVSEKILNQLPPFYAGVVCSYVYTNNLFYEAFNSSQLPQNLWCGKVYPYVDWDWVNAGFFTVSDLPLVGDKIDVIAVTTRLHNVGYAHLPYLLCCAFQANFAHLLYNDVQGTFVPNELLLLPMKWILCANLATPLRLIRWCTFLRSSRM